MSTLPFRTDLDQLKRQAKDLLRLAQAGEPAALARIAGVSAKVSLGAAQLAIAREHGFPSWAKLRVEAERKEDEKSQAGWHGAAVFGSWFDEEAHTDRQTEHHHGSCRQCGAQYVFETNIVRGFADFVEAKCPKCAASLGEFREDVGINISVRLVEAESAR
jgi:hypothetical protein